MKIVSVISSYRLVLKILTLAIMLTAWVYAPPRVAATPGAWCEEMGCVEWDAQHGCTATMFCCLFNDGGAMCWRNGQLVQMDRTIMDHVTPGELDLGVACVPKLRL